MGNNGDDRLAGKRSELRPHEEFLELCAISTSGDLTDEEQHELGAHLAGCEECRQALKEFEAAADLGVPHLASRLAGEPAGQTESTEGRGRRAFAFAHEDRYKRSGLSWNQIWLPFAASVVLSVALAGYAYRAGKTPHPKYKSDGKSLAATSPEPRIEALEQQISDDLQERQSLKAQASERDRLVADLHKQVEEESLSLERLKADEVSLEQSLASDQQQNQQLTAERDSLTERLEAAESSVRATKADLESAQQERSRAQAQDDSLAEQIKDLNGQLRDREQAINKQDDLLAHDRDIRDLMGARDLYIAEVYDVGRDGKTEKPRGRVFYTKGKSLIFYAYDLDQQPGLTSARTFQAWGRRGGNIQEALNLGIFYEDNAAKKRWVLKFDDPKTLEQIDAVFVTVEPDGGSEKPSGKPLLSAYLKIDANHP